MIISNSSPLILLAKINRLELLKKICGNIAIPYGVYNEVVVRGKKENYSDAAVVDKQINEFIFVIDLKPKHKKDAEKLKEIIGFGESEAIALCLQEKASLLLIDNLQPRKIAQVNKINCRSTPGVILEALKTDILTINEYEAAIKDLSRHAWLSGDIVAYFLEAGRKIKEAGKGDKK